VHIINILINVFYEYKSWLVRCKL